MTSPRSRRWWLVQLVWTHPARAVRGRHVAHSEQAGRGHAAAHGYLQDRGGLHLHGERASLDPVRRRLIPGAVKEVAGRDRRRACAGSHQPLEQLGVGRQGSVGAEGSAGPVGGEHRRGGEQSPELELRIERAACADPDQLGRAERDQLLADDRRTRPAHAGGLHGQRLAVRRDPGVAPQSTRVVEHLRRCLEQHLGHGERTPRIARQQNPLGQLGGRPEVIGADVVLEGQGGRTIVSVVTAPGWRRCHQRRGLGARAG